MAKKFSELTIDELNIKKNKIEEEIENLRKEYRKIEKSIKPKINKLKKIDELIDSKSLTSENIEELLNYFPETKVRRDMRTTLLSQWNLTGDAYFPDTNQACIRISLYKDDDELTKLVYNGITKLLPYIKPLPDGRKTFSIFEHTLSYNYSYYLKVTADNDYQIVTHLSYKRPIFSSKDLMETLKYIQQYYYYEEGKLHEC